MTGEGRQFHHLGLWLQSTGLRVSPFAHFFSHFDAAPHLTAPQADLVIDLHATSTPLASPPAACRQAASGFLQEVTGTNVFSLFDSCSHVVVDPASRTVRGHVYVNADGHVPPSTYGLLHLAFTLLLRTTGLYSLHAATTVADRDQPILIVGNPASGKTTLLLSFLELGYGYLGDDKVLFQALPQGQTRFLSYPREFHVGRETRRFFARFAQAQGAEMGPAAKLMLPANSYYPSQYRPHAHGSTILLFPRVASQTETHLEPLTQAEAFDHLVEASAIARVEGVAGAEAHFAQLPHIVSSAAAFAVHLGRDVLENPSGAALRVARAVGMQPPA